MSEKTFFRIIARYNGKCDGCGERIETGDDVYFDSVDRVIYCESCGEDLE